MKKNTKKHSPPKTEFLSPERVSSDTVSGQNRRVSEAPFTSDFFNMLPNITLILNKERQIVYCNKRILELLQVDNMDSFLGLRPGEAFRCVHSRETEGGCGTTKYCVNCGVALAILSTQKDGKSAVKECRLTLESEEGKASLDMRVWTSQIQLEGEALLIFSIENITDEKRRKVLEKIFFHDIRNTAGNILSFSRLMKKKGELDKGIKDISRFVRLSEQLLSEIEGQQVLVSAEMGELELNPFPVQSAQLLSSVLSLFENNPEKVRVTLSPDSEDVGFITDKTLLTRVLTNMVKNGVEATEEGGVVTLGCSLEENCVRFSVHSGLFIPENVQKQVFMRSFSTKGKNRGIGTYSMQLLSENYLQGRVYFSSSPEAGTDFFAEFPLHLEKKPGAVR